MTDWHAYSMMFVSGFYLVVASTHLRNYMPNFNRINLFFGLAALATLSIAVLRACDGLSQDAAILAMLRKIELSIFCLFSVLILRFICEYAGLPKNKFVTLLSLAWLVLLITPHLWLTAILFEIVPLKDYFQESTDIVQTNFRAPMDNLYTHAIWFLMVGTIIYSLNAGQMIFRAGYNQRGIVILLAIGLFAIFISMNMMADLESSDIMGASDLGIFVLMAIFHFYMMFESVNEKKLVEKILNYVPIGVRLVDLNGSVVFVNKAFKRFFGFGDQVFPFSSNTNISADFDRSANASFEWEHNGRKGIFEQAQFAVIDSEGNAVENCEMYVDISDDLNKEKNIHRLRSLSLSRERAKDASNIVKTIAHEISQPLAAILNNAQAGVRFLKNEQADKDEIKEILSDIIRDGKRAGAVIHSLRTLNQSKGPVLKRLDVTEVITEVVQLLEKELVKGQIILTKSLTDGIFLLADKIQIYQVLINIFINAIEAMTERDQHNCRLYVASYSEDSRAVIEIRDNGRGIPEDSLDKIFDGFYTTKPQGLGVGLEVCRAIMESHGGKIWAKNNLVYGATIYLSLPLSKGSLARDSNQ